MHFSDDQQGLLILLLVMSLYRAGPLPQFVPLGVRGGEDKNPLGHRHFALMIDGALRVAPAQQDVMFLPTVERVSHPVHIFDDALCIVPNSSWGTLGNGRQYVQGIGGQPFKTSFLSHANGTSPFGQVMGNLASRPLGTCWFTACFDGAIEKFAEAGVNEGSVGYEGCYVVVTIQMFFQKVAECTLDFRPVNKRKIVRLFR